jgi:hypothetical protein
MARQSGAVTGFSKQLPDHSSRLSQTPEAPANRRAQDTQIGRIPKHKHHGVCGLCQGMPVVPVKPTASALHMARAWVGVSKTAPSAFACAIRLNWSLCRKSYSPLYFFSQSMTSCITFSRCSQRTGKCGDPG